MSNKDKNIRGVGTIEIGPPGDGVVGSSLTSFGSARVVLSSVNLGGGKSTVTTINTEGEDNYLSVGTGSDPKTLGFKLLEVTADEAVLILGGSYDAPSKTWSAPIAAQDIYASVILTDIKGNKVIFPYARIAASHEGNITKGELVSVDIVATANVPVSAANVKGSPYQVVHV